jgi:hypothetical protein
LWQGCGKNPDFTPLDAPPWQRYALIAWGSKEFQAKYLRNQNNRKYYEAALNQGKI